MQTDGTDPGTEVNNAAPCGSVSEGRPADYCWLLAAVLLFKAFSLHSENKSHIEV